MNQKTQTLAFWLAVAAYVALALLLQNAPLQDAPNHLARAHIMADLLFSGGAQYGQDFALDLSYRPYLTMDLILASLDRLLGSAWTARVWIAVAVALTPLGTRFVLRSLNASKTAELTAGVLSLLVATGWTFVMGFLTYQVSVGCALFAIGWFLHAQHSRSVAVWLAYALLVFVSYAAHLSALIFVGAFVGMYSAVRFLQGAMTFKRAATLVAVPAALVAGHLYFAEHGVTGYTEWGGPIDKLIQLASPIIRFSRLIDMALYLGLVLIVLVPLLRTPRLDVLRQSLVLWICGVTYVLMYFVLPTVGDAVYHVDMRALPYAILVLTWAGVLAAESFSRHMRWQLLAAFVLAAANLYYLSSVLLPLNASMGRYREIAAMVPAGAKVLPINSHDPVGRRYRPFQHAGAYATLDAGAWTPYLFAADLNSPMKYFRYREGRGYFPSEYWYEQVDPMEPSPSWKQVEEQYDYLLVDRPWEAKRLPARYTVVTENDVAALLRVVKK